MKKVIILFFLLISAIPKLYSQQKPHTIFNKDSLISVTNYISKFKTIDSMVVKTEKKTIVISEKDILPFYKKTNDTDEELGICPFATEIRFLNKHLIIITAILRNSLFTSFYIFTVNRKTGKLIKTVKVESPKKGLDILSILNVNNKIFIPKKGNFIIDDFIKVFDKKTVRLINTSNKYLKAFKLGASDDNLTKETYFHIQL